MAGEDPRMRLCDHADFETFIARAAETTGIPEAFVEKDYWVTRLLQTAEAQLGAALIFKGGTSLSKGWGLIKRFSEDIDLLVNPSALPSPWDSPSKVDRGLRSLIHEMKLIPELTHERVAVSGGSSRQDGFSYASHFSDVTGLPARILVEPGIGGGYLPVERRTISSYVVALAPGSGVDVDREDLPFDINVLHPRRTFVEKMFTVHGAVAAHAEGTRQIGRDARHFADLHALAGTDDIVEFVQSEAYPELVGDVDAASREFYADRYRVPPDLNLAESGVFPSGDLAVTIAAAYDTECRRLFFGGAYPSFAEVQSRLESLRAYL